MSPVLDLPPLAGPSFLTSTSRSVAFGHILTRLTAAKEEGAFVTTPDGNKVALGIPKAQKEAAGSGAYADIPLRRAGTATEAASVILAVASPLFSYVNGQTIMVSSPWHGIVMPLLTVSGDGRQEYVILENGHSCTHRAYRFQRLKCFHTI